MKKLLLSLILALSIMTPMMEAHRMSSQINIVFKETNKTVIPKKSLEIIPVGGTYNTSTCVVSLWFTYDMGDVVIDVTNTTTGVSYGGTYDTQYLNVMIWTSGSQGSYTVTVTLSSGTEYEGEFDVI